MNENCFIFNSQAWESEPWKGALMCVSGCRRLSFPGCRASRGKHRKQSTEVRAKAIAPTWSQGCSLLHCEVGLWGGLCMGLDEIMMWGPHKGISVLWEETKNFSPSFSPSLSPFVPPHHVYTQQKGDFLQARKKALTKNWICQPLDLGRPSLQRC